MEEIDPGPVRRRRQAPDIASTCNAKESGRSRFPAVHSPGSGRKMDLNGKYRSDKLLRMTMTEQLSRSLGVALRWNWPIGPVPVNLSPKWPPRILAAAGVLPR